MILWLSRVFIINNLEGLHENVKKLGEMLGEEAKESFEDNPDTEEPVLPSARGRDRKLSIRHRTTDISWILKIHETGIMNPVKVFVFLNPLFFVSTFQKSYLLPWLI